MGTTQRIVPGVPGQPNWKNLNKAITDIAKTVEKENSQQNDTPDDPDKAATEYQNLVLRRNNHLKSAFRNLVKTGGGSNIISSGKSSSLGKAGIRSSKKIAGFFSGVSSGGLQQALIDIGFGSLNGKKIQDVVDFLLIYCSDSNTGMDETAANKASSEVFNELAEQTGNDLDKFEELIKGSVEGNGLADILCRFWGLYIFEHLSQRFQEKITQQKGEFISNETFKIIKDDILGQVRVLNEQREVSKIDWKGEDGQKAIESIFQSIINIIGDENSN
ncbi:MAG: hypothetical protein H7Y13_12110 [Sphingobacteriaceae bacterium]|nr:hypothetical protein [Sphingobacteriaceae bacterium]